MAMLFLLLCFYAIGAGSFFFLSVRPVCIFHKKPILSALYGQRLLLSCVVLHVPLAVYRLSDQFCHFVRHFYHETIRERRVSRTVHIQNKLHKWHALFVNPPYKCKKSEFLVFCQSIVPSTIPRHCLTIARMGAASPPLFIRLCSDPLHTIMQGNGIF